VKVAVLIVSILSFTCRDTLTCHFTARANREAALRHDLFEIRHAIDDFYADKQRYPESLEALVRDHYLRTLPADPLTGSSDKLDPGAKQRQRWLDRRPKRCKWNGM